MSRDLFSDGGRAYMDDKALAQRLMMERLKEEAEKEATVNGWPAKQIKCAKDVPWNYYSHWEWSDATKFSRLPQRARDGAVLHLGMGRLGKIDCLVLVKKGTLTPPPSSSPIGEDAPPAEKATPISGSLAIELRAMRLSILRRMLSDARDGIARDLLTFVLARKIYVNDHSCGQAVGLAVSGTGHPNLADSYGDDRLPSCAIRADEALSEREKGLLEWVGVESDAEDDDRLEDLQLARFREMPDDRRDLLLTCCVARMLTPSRPGGCWVDRAIHGSIQIPWPVLFDPGEVILSRLTKAQLLEIARRDFPPGQLDTGMLAGLTKAELVEHVATASAEYRAANGESPWLPAEVFGGGSASERALAAA